MTQLIIKGAFYFDGETVLQPHYTGEFHTVDCTEFKTEEQIKLEYSKSNVKTIIKEAMQFEHNGTIYYECEYSPYHVEDWELLSDLSDLEYTGY